jgi:4-hydroxy-tetrahydrodipicolinate reductase
VFFLGSGETIEITHRAMGREIFARGAIFAAEKFQSMEKPGLYGLSDII